jgi:hypothetical protein
MHLVLWIQDCVIIHHRRKEAKGRRKAKQVGISSEDFVICGERKLQDEDPAVEMGGWESQCALPGYPATADGGNQMVR